jgi:hypothetical protein
MVAHTVTAGPGRTDRALDTAPMVGHAQPSPGQRVGQRLSPTQGVGSAEPWQVSGYRGWTAQPVPGAMRCVA